MPKVDLDAIDADRTRPAIPARSTSRSQGRWWRRIAPAAGLTEFGASHVTLEPGAWSSQRHWHDGEDEMVVMLTGEAVLVEDDGERELRPGDVAAWPKGVTNGHQLDQPDERCPAPSSPSAPARSTTGGYSDIDMIWARRRPLPPSRRTDYAPTSRRRRLLVGSYSSMTQGSSWASSIHSTTSAWCEHRLHVGGGEGRDRDASR